MKKALVMIGAGLILGGAGIGCQRAPASPAPKGSTAPPSQTLKDFEMNDTRRGAKTMTLQSIEARIYEEKNLADVDQPVIFFYKLGQISSRLRAPMGQVKMDTHDVETWGGVTVVTADSATLTTERLRYDPKKDMIFSDDPVRVEKPDSITEGIGIESDPQLDVVKIRRQTARIKKAGRS